ACDALWADRALVGQVDAPFTRCPTAECGRGCQGSVGAGDWFHGDGDGPKAGEPQQRRGRGLCCGGSIIGRPWPPRSNSSMTRKPPWPPFCNAAAMIPSRYLGGDFVVVACHGFELLAQFWIGF